MAIRNYSELSSYDFECLVRDLLQADWGVRLETFAPGPDAGVDIRLLGSRSDKRVNVQCKHSPNGSWGSLVSSLRKEATRNHERDLREYWLVTSASLTARAKSAASALFSAQDLVDHHVLGREDLDNMLTLHPTVEQANYKLYLSSVAVIQRILRNEAFVRQQALSERIMARRRLYVQNDGFYDAMKLLKEHRLCVISGEPGVGKTTLADMLVLDLVSRGYEPIAVEDDIADVDRLWKSDSKQVFLYDDFLGQNTLEQKLRSGEDTRIPNVIQRLAASKNHYLILTTREYILRAAQATYATLSSPDFTMSKYTLDLGSYTRFQRGHILYNHVYFSELPRAAGRSLARNQAFRAIVEHKNFNPRLIDSLVAAAVREGGRTAGKGFAKYAAQTLEDPSSLWLHILDRQLPPLARDISIAMAALPERSPAEVVRVAVSALLEARGQPLSDREFADAMRVLEGVFVDVNRDDSGVSEVAFRNPGVRDFVTDYVLRDQGLLRELVASVRSPEQVERITSWVNGKSGPPARGKSSEETIAVARSIVKDAATSLIVAVFGDSIAPSSAMSSWRRRDARAVDRAVEVLLGFLGPDIAKSNETALADQLIAHWMSDQVELELGYASRVLTLLARFKVTKWRSLGEILVSRVGGYGDDATTLATKIEIAEVIDADPQSLVEELVAYAEDQLDSLSQLDPSSIRTTVEELETALDRVDLLGEFEDQIQGGYEYASRFDNQDEEDDREYRGSNYSWSSRGPSGDEELQMLFESFE